MMKKKSVSNSEAKRQYLTFVLAGEVYAFDVLKLRDIIEYSKITKVPKTAPFIAGVINLRGNVIPVVDLRIKFGMPISEISIDSSIVIVEVDMDGENVVIGTIVDSVKEVIELADSAIEAAPKLGGGINSELLLGMGKTDDGFIIIFDAEKVFSIQELSNEKKLNKRLT